jgi:hypothetical protein
MNPSVIKTNLRLKENTSNIEGKSFKPVKSAETMTEETAIKKENKIKSLTEEEVLAEVSIPIE